MFDRLLFARFRSERKAMRQSKIKQSTPAGISAARQSREERLVRILREEILRDQLERERVLRSPLARIQIAALGWLKSAHLGWGRVMTVRFRNARVPFRLAR
jgi:hypothetical protein